MDPETRQIVGIALIAVAIIDVVIANVLLERTIKDPHKLSTVKAAIHFGALVMGALGALALLNQFPFKQ